jgi:hypothetical protein
MSMPQSAAEPLSVRVAGGRGASAWGSTHVDFAILEALLQIVVDGLVRHLADECEIRDADFLLLGALEDGLLCELRLLLPTGGGLLLAPCALRNSLYTASVSVCRGKLRVCARFLHTMAGAQLRPQVVPRVSRWRCRVCCRVRVCSCGEG